MVHYVEHGIPDKVLKLALIPEDKPRARQGINCTFWLAKAGALLRCPPLAGRVSACKRIPFRRRIACDPKSLLHLAVLALHRVGRLALHPAVAAKRHNLFLDGP